MAKQRDFSWASGKLSVSDCGATWQLTTDI